MRNFVCIALLLCLTLSSKAQPDSSFHLYLLVGQSNMAGRGEITLHHRDLTYPGIYMLDRTRAWLPARHPLHFDKPVAGVGPGLSFAKAMRDATPADRLGLVPCAVGGTSIDSWVPGGYDSATKTHPYDDAVARIRIARQAGVFKGIIWHQGESDSKPAKAALYLEKLKTLVERLRKETGSSVMPFVAGELGGFRPVYKNINNELQKLPRAVPHSALATSAGLDHKGDSTHFNAAAADEMGKRMAARMIILQNLNR
jgi:carbohydrate esterase-like sialic acid-specific acetylesterase